MKENDLTEKLDVIKQSTACDLFGLTEFWSDRVKEYELHKNNNQCSIQKVDEKK